MRFLLDTHVVLWVMSSDPSLKSTVREVLRDPRSRVHVSAVSAWEITVKKALGTLRAPDDLVDQLDRHRFSTLAITVERAMAVGDLPAHHADPFDRMLVAQARVEGATIVTRDPQIGRYDVAVLDT